MRERFPADCPAFRMARNWGRFEFFRRCPREGQIVAMEDIDDRRTALLVRNLDARHPQTAMFGDDVGWACVRADLIPLTTAARKALALIEDADA